jgi:hypothetical protein
MCGKRAKSLKKYFMLAPLAKKTLGWQFDTKESLGARPPQTPAHPGSPTVSPSHPVGWRTQALGMTQQGATLQNYNNELVKCERFPTSQIMPTPTADMYSAADTQASKTSVKSERR